MPYYTLSLQAGIPYTHNVAGKLILLDRTGAADGIDIATIRNGTPQTTMPGRKAAFRLVESYDGVTLTASVDATIGIFLSFDDVQLGVADGSAVKVPDGVNITNADPIPVLFGGTVAPVLGVVTVDNTDGEAIPVLQKTGDVFTVQAAQMGNIVDHGPAVINTGAAQLLVSDATLKGLRIKNASATARVALGGAAVTMANASILLEPGDMWLEDDTACAAWYAVSDTAGADVRVMGVK